ncbi:hypothetical protein CHLNCDRAFT_143054 [Chlorella variabilis]|uniref:Shikimate dehydrogenase substrate binding N-terminal domain-containing protein n=1 Tax=Chlorella variabilis TaxID=554065 RepID=E1Z9D5_CHLVA|nr:hypothetical protein CHLNCDRAFT_143054 [Chlorella variabilis]EFN57759.1 hypothetical protein CHLNCDRAFT_143054 [Chlorella variabilis]|eukprot:XP_005849861.1 hypothetical protein CHLNCDRAFT_143054 [Chlorella variabilis]
MEAAQASSSAGGGGAGATPRTHLCTSLVAPTVEGMLAEAQEAEQNGADIVELRLDYLQQFAPEADLSRLLQACPLPAIVTYRPTWEGGKYDGPEPQRLAALRLAALSGAAYVDVELKVAPAFFAGTQPWAGGAVIVSSHDYERTASEEELMALVERCHGAGADIVKFATMANDITDAHRVLSVLRRCPVPCIALAMGERGQISRLLAPKYGGFLTFGALSPDRASAPGQPTLQQLSGMYGLKQQRRDTAVLGIVGNPVSHSRSPAIHNAALRQAGLNGVYVPLLVDDMPSFLATFTGEDETPVPATALGGYRLVFDAVYTPLHTRLLRDAATAGCAVVTGDTMFVGQAADQFRLFTGVEAPVELMRSVVLDSLKQ